MHAQHPWGLYMGGGHTILFHGNFMYHEKAITSLQTYNVSTWKSLSAWIFPANNKTIKPVVMVLAKEDNSQTSNYVVRINIPQHLLPLKTVSYFKSGKKKTKWSQSLLTAPQVTKQKTLMSETVTKVAFHFNETKTGMNDLNFVFMGWFPVKKKQDRLITSRGNASWCHHRTRFLALLLGSISSCLDHA